MHIRIITTMALFFLIQSLQADCPHCFTAIKVRLEYVGGQTEEVYMKFFRSYELERDEQRPAVGEDVKPYLSSGKETIFVVDTIYHIKPHFRIVEKENIREVAIQQVESIKLIAWTEVGGAGELPRLPHESIQRIIKSDTLLTTSREYTCFDNYYIYPNGDLSRKQFDAFIQFAIDYSETNPTLSRSLIQGETFREQSEKKESVLEIMDWAFDDFYQQVDRRIKDRVGCDFSPKFHTYFTQQKSALRLKKDYYTLLQYYLKTGKTEELISFVDENVKDDKIHEVMITKLSQTSDSVLEMCQTVKYLARKYESTLHSLGIDGYFLKIMEDNGVITLSVSLD